MRGLKHHRPINLAVPDGVAPSQVRGLKPDVHYRFTRIIIVAPSQVRGLKLEALQGLPEEMLVAPSQVRGLKLDLI